MSGYVVGIAFHRLYLRQAGMMSVERGNKINVISGRRLSGQ